MKWHELDAKAQRKALILAAIVAAMVAALLWPSGMWRAKPRPGPLPVRTEPQVGRETPRPIPRPVPPPAKDAGLLGKWQSMNALVPNHGLCTLWVEVARKADDPEKYTAAVSLSCLPTAPLTAPKADTPMTMMLAEREPLLASMSGAWEKDAIVFRVDKVLNPKQCGLTGFSVSRFGSQNLAAELHDGCGGGSMVMRKVG